MFYCPKCGKELKVSSETLGICSICGPVTPTGKPTVTTTPSQPSVSVTVATTPSHPSGDPVGYCKKCGKTLTSDARFCEFCGISVTQPVASIPNPISAFSTSSDRKKLLAMLLVAFAIGVAIGGSSVRTSPEVGYITITKSYAASYLTITRTVTGATYPETSAQTVAQGEWKTIATLAGSGDKDTEDFNVPTNYWRIVYTISQEYSGGYTYFRAYIHRSGEAGDSVASVELGKSGTETSYIREGPGDFWIKVVSGNVDSWTIEVQIQ